MKYEANVKLIGAIGSLFLRRFSKHKFTAGLSGVGNGNWEHCSNLYKICEKSFWVDVFEYFEQALIEIEITNK
jgi:hypothetical protein